MCWTKYLVLNSTEFFKTTAKLPWLTDHQAKNILLMKSQPQLKEDNRDTKSNLSVFQTVLFILQSFMSIVAGKAPA